MTENLFEAATSALMREIFSHGHPDLRKAHRERTRVQNGLRATLRILEEAGEDGVRQALADSPRQREDAPRRLETDGEQRVTCRCDQRQYRSREDAMRATAGKPTDPVVDVYQCPGAVRWHVAGPWFRPEMLCAYARRLAYALLRDTEVRLDAFRTGVLQVEGGSAGWRRAGAHARQLAAIGAIQLGPADNGPGKVAALANRTVALRVVQFGLPRRRTTRTAGE